MSRNQTAEQNDPIHDEENKPEKDKINVYDNDDAYMLNDEKDHAYIEDHDEGNVNEIEHDEHFDHEIDMGEDFHEDEVNMEHGRDMDIGSDEEGTVRNKLEGG